MNVSGSTDSMLSWSITTPMGEQLSTDLPRVYRTFEEFIAVDIWSGDSDPVYWAVVGANREWGHGWATRFCVGMLAYYHTGTAAKAADYEGAQFWDYLESIYSTNPRGSERRHMRGAGGQATLQSMRKWSPDPLNFFGFPTTYKGVRSNCEGRLYGFGPYFQLKICDYMDRCLGIPVLTYDGLARNLPTEPARAVKLMYPDVSHEYGFNALCERVNLLGLKAAPMFDRPVGPAEVETSLCGWKTTKFKGNWMGADILDKRNALKGYGDKADRMVSMMPPLVPQGTFLAEL